MVVEIQFLDKPRFAQGPKFNATTQRPFSGAGANTAAAVINISASGTAKGEKAGRSLGASVFSQITSQLKDITTQIKNVDKAISSTAAGTAEHTALEKERSGIEKEFQRITSPKGPDGQDSPFANLLSYLDTATNSFNQRLNGLSADQATTLFGNDGAAFLQRGGAAAAQEIAEALKTVSADGASISDPTILSKIDDSLSRIGQLFSGEVFENADSGGSRSVLSNGPNSHPIELQEVNFVAAGQISLSLQSASPEDLMRAAASGIDVSLVNHLLLKPDSFDPKREGERQSADETVIDLAKKDPNAPPIV